MSFLKEEKEINKLLNEDASLYEEGTNSSSQTGEEYRQTLRKVLENQERKEEIINIPWKAGSGMRKGKYQGIFFLAKVGERPYLRFVHADKEWKLKYFIPSEDKKKMNEQLDLGDKKLTDGELELNKKPMIDEELGFCLRIIECDEKEKKIMNNKIEEAAYNLWLEAKKNIYERWNFETDPINLQPKVRLLNRNVAEFIRKNPPPETKQNLIEKTLNILESPWSRKDEGLLREWYQSELEGTKLSKFLIEKILNSGLEPFIQPEPLPPIKEDDIKLIVWMAIEKEEK